MSYRRVRGESYAILNAEPIYYWDWAYPFYHPILGSFRTRLDPRRSVRTP